MSAGIPLTDEDRWAWLASLRDECVLRLTSASDVVMTCSALKKCYRDVLRTMTATETPLCQLSASPSPLHSASLCVRFVYLHAPEEVVTQRALARKGHYMAAGMVHSQYSILELPGKDECADVIWIDATKTLDEVKQSAVTKVMQMRRRWNLAP